MKYIVVLVALCASLVVNGEKPQSHPNQNKQEPDRTAQSASDALGGTITVVNQQAPQGQANSHPAKSPSYLDRLFSPENIPNIALVIVGAITAYYIAKQARETKLATQAMQRSTRLQEVGLRQWVDTDNWTISATKYIHYVLGRLIGQIKEKPETIDIEITFDVVNSSPRPLTVQKVAADVHIAGRQDWQNIVSDDKNHVPPEGKHHVVLPVTLTGDEVDRYILDRLQVSVSGRVFYEDGLGNGNEQTFSECAKCGVNGSKFFAYIGKAPTEQSQDRQAD